MTLNRSFTQMFTVRRNLGSTMSYVANLSYLYLNIK